MHKAPWSGTFVTGPATLDASAAGNWAGKALIVSPVAAAAAPTASFTLSCTKSVCDLDGSGSSAPGSSISSYAWDFGDGSAAGSGMTVSHTYPGTGTYPVTLTVTNAQQATASVTKPVTVAATTPSGVAFVAQASSNGNATTETVTVPGDVSAGDALVLIATGATGGSLTAPAGWTTLGSASAGTAITTTAWQKAATATDQGSHVTVTFPAVVHGTVQLLAYAGATTPAVASVAKAARATGTSFTTPTSAAPNDGDVVVSYWAAKSSSVTGWTTPSGQNIRSVANGSGTGRINSVAADAGPTGAGPVGGLTATTSGSAGAYGAWTIVLDGSGSAPPPPPNADFNVTCTLLSCHFDGSTSAAPGGTITSYSWDFGDGSPATGGMTADHTFATAGTYQVRLAVTDSNSNAGSKTLPVTVSASGPPRRRSLSLARPLPTATARRSQ